TDKRVRSADNLAECLMQATDPARMPTPKRLGLNVSNALDEVFARALAVNPRERAQDVGEFWGQLRNAMLREAEEVNQADVDSIPPGIDGEGDDPATIVADTTGMFDDMQNGQHEDEPTRNVDLNSPQFSQGQGLPAEVKDFLSRAQQQSSRSQDANNSTMAMQPPAAGAPWPPTPLPAAGRPAPNQATGQAGGFAPGTNAGPGGMPLDSNGEPATLAMHSPLGNQIFQQQLGQQQGTIPEAFAPPGHPLNSPQFQQAAALGMTMPLINNGPGMMPPGVPQAGQMGGGQPPGAGAYPGPVPPGVGAPGTFGQPGMPPGQPGNFAAPAQGWQPPPNAGPGVFQAAQPASKKMPIIFVAVVFAIVVLAVALVFAVRYVQTRGEPIASSDTSASSDTGSIPTAAATIPTAAATDPVIAPTAALTAPTGTSVFDQQPTAVPTETAAPTATPTPTATHAPTPTATQEHPTPTPTPVNHPTPVPTPTPTTHPTPTPTSGGGFDQAAATKSLHGMESILSSCMQPNGPTGTGSVRVTFANDGSAMSSVMVGPPYQGTKVGDCAASRFKLA
ncbi:MAG: hypothetical protein ABI551_01870, partial [Polyangiaceae bacterium]